MERCKNWPPYILYDHVEIVVATSFTSPTFKLHAALVLEIETNAMTCKNGGCGNCAENMNLEDAITKWNLNYGDDGPRGMVAVLG